MAEHSGTILLNEIAPINFKSPAEWGRTFAPNGIENRRLREVVPLRNSIATKTIAARPEDYDRGRRATGVESHRQGKTVVSKVHVN
jgi:hypothetical protein